MQCFIRLESLELVMCMIDSNLRVRTKCRLLGAQLITQARFNDTIIFIDKTFNVIQYLVTSKRSFVILIAFLTLNIICTIIIITDVLSTFGRFQCVTPIVCMKNVDLMKISALNS